MCGIAGLAGAGATSLDVLEGMTQAMLSRGPDGQGIWQDDTVGLAFRRLAIIDLNDRSNQPFHLDHLHLVFNGEIYNYLELREELRGLGHDFVTEGDAEVLLHAWAEWSEAALDRLNGMFAFGIWDDRARRLVLAVDRFAEKPLFVHRAADRLAFASDVRALRAADPRIGIPDRAAVERFVALGTMPLLPATFFADVQRLPAAHLATWTPEGSFQLRRWWQPRSVDVPSEPVAAARVLRELLAASVMLRMRSDVPVGTSLSGGIDSSTIVGLVSQVAGGQRREAFTATFPGFQRDEWRYAQAVAASAGVAFHHAVKPTVGELLEDLSQLVSDQGEPFGTTSIYAQWRVMRAAREAGVVVLLDGQGADELLGGYPGIEGWVVRSQGIGTAVRAVLRDRRLAERVAIAYSAGRAPRAVGRRHRMMSASPYVAQSVARAAADGVQGPLDWATGTSPLHRELLTQAFSSSLPNLCRFADHNSMAFGVEVRFPFLDPSVAEFALSLPPSLIWHDGFTKRCLRDAARGLVPDVILDRKDKVGYETPQEMWFATEAGRAALGAILLDGETDAPYVRVEIERDLRRGVWRDPNAVWRAANVALWLAELRRPVALAGR